MPIVKFYDLTTETTPVAVSYFIQEGDKTKVFRAFPVDKLCGVPAKKLLALREKKDQERAKAGIPQPEDVVSTEEAVGIKKRAKKQKKKEKKSVNLEPVPEKVGSTQNILQGDVDFVDETGKLLRTNEPTKPTEDVEFTDETGHPICLTEQRTFKENSPNQETSSLSQDVPIKQESEDEDEGDRRNDQSLKGEETAESKSCTGCGNCGLSKSASLNKKRANFEVLPEPIEGKSTNKRDFFASDCTKRTRIETASDFKTGKITTVPSNAVPGEEFCRLWFDGEDIHTGPTYTTLGVHTESLGHRVTPNHFGHLLHVEERTGFYAKPPHNIETGGLVCTICLHDHQDRVLKQTCPNCEALFHQDCWDSWLNGTKLANNCCPWCQEFVVWDQYLAEGIVPTSALASTKQYWDKARFNYQLLRHIPFVYEKLSAEGSFVLPIKFSRELRGYDLLEEVDPDHLDIQHFGV